MVISFKTSRHIKNAKENLSDIEPILEDSALSCNQRFVSVLGQIIIGEAKLQGISHPPRVHAYVTASSGYIPNNCSFQLGIQEMYYTCRKCIHYRQKSTIKLILAQNTVSYL